MESSLCTALFYRFYTTHLLINIFIHEYTKWILRPGIYPCTSLILTEYSVLCT